MTTLSNMGQRVQDCRIAVKLTQSELSEKTGIHQRTISRIEKGVRLVTTPEVDLFAKAFGLTIEDFLSGKPVKITASTEN